MSIPEAADWEGYPRIADAGTTYEHTFERAGTYEYVCEPHATDGMEGEVLGGTPLQRSEHTINVGLLGRLEFDPDIVDVEPGTTLTWLWNTDGHDLVPVEWPQGADWRATPTPPAAGTTHEYTFDVPGAYEFGCASHDDVTHGRFVVSDE